MLVADLLGGVVAGPAKAEFNEGRVIVQVVDLVVDAVVLAVGAFGAEGARHEPGVLHRVVEGFLGRPFDVVAQVMDLHGRFFHGFVAGRQIGLQVAQGQPVFVHEPGNGQPGQMEAGEVGHGEIGLLAQGTGGLGDGIAVLGLGLAVEYQRNVELQGDLRGQVLLAENEGLEGVEQVFQAQPGEEPVNPAVGLEGDVVEPAGLDPGQEILPAVVGVEQGRPSHGQRVHAVLIFEQMGGHDAVLAAAARHQAVVGAVVFAMPVEQGQKPALAVLPVDVLLAFGVAAGVAHAFLVDAKRRRDPVRGMQELGIGGRPLVGHDAAGAKPDFAGEPVAGGEGLGHGDSSHGAWSLAAATSATNRRYRARPSRPLRSG